MAPEGYVRVRSYIRRKPQPSAKKMSGWTIAALVALVWLWGQIFGFGSSTTETHPAQPQPAASAPAANH